MSYMWLKKQQTYIWGLIRNDGGSGNEFVDGFKYYQCNDCELVYINNIPKNIDSFYESSEFQLFLMKK